MSPKAWVETAEELLNKDSQSEADWRSAAHACYYAVYHASAAHFRLDTTTADAKHGDVQDLLHGLTFVPAPPRFVVKARTVYKELKKLRIRADYHINESFTADEADRSLQLAQMVVNALGR